MRFTIEETFEAVVIALEGAGKLKAIPEGHGQLKDSYVKIKIMKYMATVVYITPMLSASSTRVSPDAMPLKNYYYIAEIDQLIGRG